MSSEIVTRGPDAPPAYWRCTMVVRHGDEPVTLVPVRSDGTEGRPFRCYFPAALRRRFRAGACYEIDIREVEPPLILDTEPVALIVGPA